MSMTSSRLTLSGTSGNSSSFCSSWAATFFCSADAVSSVSGGAPTSGAKSSKSRLSETRFAVSTGFSGP